MKELGPELLNWRIMYPWCHSSSNRFLCSLPYLAFVYLTHSPHPPGMCQQPARLTWRELTQLNWPRTLYLQSHKCHVTLLETHTVCKDARSVQVIHHCLSAKSIMLRRKQSGQVMYNVWDFKVLFPWPKIPYYPTTKALVLSPQINLFNHKLLLRRYLFQQFPFGKHWASIRDTKMSKTWFVFFFSGGGRRMDNGKILCDVLWHWQKLAKVL